MGGPGTMKANGRVVTTDAMYIAADAIGDFALVGWTRPNGDVMVARRNPDGSAAGIARRVGTSATGPVAITAADDRYLVAWGGTLGQIYGAIVSPIGLPIVPAVPITTQSNGSVGAIAAAAAADGFAVVWHDVPGFKSYAITLDTNGVPVSMDLLPITGRAFPDVTSNGENFLVVWNGMQSRTLTVDRKLGIVHNMETGSAPKVAWDGQAYAVVFVREVSPRGGFSFPVLFGTRVTIYGTHVESLGVGSGILLPGDWDVDAVGGRIDVVHTGGSAVAVQSSTADAPRTRIRAVRH